MQWGCSIEIVDYRAIAAEINVETEVELEDRPMNEARKRVEWKKRRTEWQKKREGDMAIRMELLASFSGFETLAIVKREVGRGVEVGGGPRVGDAAPLSLEAGRGYLG